MREVVIQYGDGDEDSGARDVTCVRITDWLRLGDRTNEWEATRTREYPQVTEASRARLKRLRGRVEDARKAVHVRGAWTVFRWCGDEGPPIRRETGQEGSGDEWWLDGERLDIRALASWADTGGQERRTLVAALINRLTLWERMVEVGGLWAGRRDLRMARVALAKIRQLQAAERTPPRSA